jgi:hypothetical protein
MCFKPSSAYNYLGDPGLVPQSLSLIFPLCKMKISVTASEGGEGEHIKESI